jgi:signal transduction histidine kinase
MDARLVAALAELSQSARADTDLPTLMGQAVALMAHTLDLQYSAIWELLPDRSALILRAGVGWPAGTVGRVTIHAGATALACCAEPDTSPIFITNWESETRFGQPSLLRDHGVASSLCAILHGRDRPFGMLCADSATRRMFINAEAHFLQTVAHLLALVIERVEAKQALEQRVSELAHENARLVAAAQDQAILEERQRLSRDLHDSVTQALYGVTLHAEAATRLLASGDVVIATDYVRELQNTAQEALDEMRLLIFELRPPILEQAGLVAALRARLGAVEGRANLETRLIADGVSDLPSPVEQALYRIAQEALNNALKHAHARCIIVQLCQAPASITLEIIDDGVGFDPATAHTAGGLGLHGIAERVAQLGGLLVMQSAAGAGTHVRVEIEL